MIVIGDGNDIVLYRDLKAMGVAEYFSKPLAAPPMNRALGAILEGRPAYSTVRTGKLITILGLRGGVGATTIATNLAWHSPRRIEVICPTICHKPVILVVSVQPPRLSRRVCG